MELTDKRIKQLTKRILLARLRLLSKNGFYGLLLMHLGFALSDWCETAATDGKKIYFSADFVDGLDDTELEFVLMHEVLHAALQHGARRGNRNSLIFNIACDIVVNSNIKRACGGSDTAISLKNFGGTAMHIAPDGKEGYEYTAEQVYKMLIDNAVKIDMQGQWDDHSRLGGGDGDDANEMSNNWTVHLDQAIKAMEKQRENGRSSGSVPMLAERLLKEFKTPKIDWRRVLTEFVQEDILDYTFSPPDRRFGDLPFFLPDLNVADVYDHPGNVLFMVDTSASVTDDEIAAAYSEIKGAIDQFDGRLKGLLGFFDANVWPPVPFESVRDLKAVVPRGGGGTSFFAVFEYIKQNMPKDPPKSIVILTDGEAEFPKESAALGIPVLWVLTSEHITPPWGRKVCIK